MALRTKIQPINESIRLVMDGALSPDALSREFRTFAVARIAEADAINLQAMGTAPDKDTIVNGRRGAGVETATAPGLILVEYHLVSQVIADIFARLQALAPVRRGRFRDSIWIFADGVRVQSPKDALGAREVVMVATVAYARKLEGARGGRAPLSRQAPHGVFEVAAQEAARRFGNRAMIKYTMAEVSASGSHLGEWAAGRARARGTGGAAKRQGAKDRRNPAITIRFR